MLRLHMTVENVRAFERNASASGEDEEGRQWMTCDSSYGPSVVCLSDDAPENIVPVDRVEVFVYDPIGELGLH